MWRTELLFNKSIEKYKKEMNTETDQMTRIFLDGMIQGLKLGKTFLPLEEDKNI